MLLYPDQLTIFHDRREAGCVLAERLSHYQYHAETIVLALPRGGVPVGFEVARILHLPLDVFIVRKLGMPGFEELAMGAIASGGVRVVNEEVLDRLENPQEELDRATAVEGLELQRREVLYRAGREPLDVHEKTVILVDDGLATGATMRAAVEALRRIQVARCVVAVPVAAADTCNEFRMLADEVVCAMASENFGAVGQFYQNFAQTSDREVRDLLARAAANSGTP